jgi:hypothetical protein
MVFLHFCMVARDEGLDSSSSWSSRQRNGGTKREAYQETILGAPLVLVAQAPPQGA